MAIAAQASGPKPQTPCKTRTGVEQGAANYFNNSDTSDSATRARLQRLLPLGIIGFRADLIARLAWGDAL